MIQYLPVKQFIARVGLYVYLCVFNIFLCITTGAALLTAQQVTVEIVACYKKP
jgi:hypothetical protein